MFRAIYLWFTRYSRLKAEHGALQHRQGELIGCFQELEKSCRVVVNRKIPCLAGIPSWKDKARAAQPARPGYNGGQIGVGPSVVTDSKDFKPFNPRKGFKEFRNEWERKNNTIAPRIKRRAKEYEGIPEGEANGRTKDIG